MALKKSLTINVFGENKTFQESYHKVTNLNGDKDELSIQLSSFDKDDKEHMIKQQYYEFKPDVSDVADNFLKQSYEYLKSLDEFSDSVDC